MRYALRMSVLAALLAAVLVVPSGARAVTFCPDGNGYWMGSASCDLTVDGTSFRIHGIAFAPSGQVASLTLSIAIGDSLVAVEVCTGTHPGGDPQIASCSWEIATSALTGLSAAGMKLTCRVEGTVEGAYGCSSW